MQKKLVFIDFNHFSKKITTTTKNFLEKAQKIIFSKNFDLISSYGPNVISKYKDTNVKEGNIQ